MIAKRKPLGDDIMGVGLNPDEAAFIKGTAPSKTKASKTTVEKKDSVLKKLMTEANTEKEPTVRITVDVPKSMHQQLSLFCAQTGRKKAEVIRMLLEEALNEVNA